MKRGTTLTIFQISGKVPESNDMLIIFVKLGAITEAESFSNLALIRSRTMLYLFSIFSARKISEIRLLL